MHLVLMDLGAASAVTLFLVTVLCLLARFTTVKVALTVLAFALIGLGCFTVNAVITAKHQVPVATCTFTDSVEMGHPCP